jgi:DNA mismatch repair protein MutS
MNETASILHNLSDRSLILLDEIGRGTSTYDGLSIAWAIVEYIHEHPTAKAKTLFATHYHELNEMEALFPRIKNYNVSVKELDHRVMFLRTLQRGGVAHSFGIHVARMAGMPQLVVARADNMLKKLEKNHLSPSLPKEEGIQLSIFQLDDPVLVALCQALDQIKLERLSPLEAFDALRKLKEMANIG